MKRIQPTGFLHLLRLSHFQPHPCPPPPLPPPPPHWIPLDLQLSLPTTSTFHTLGMVKWPKIKEKLFLVTHNRIYCHQHLKWRNCKVCGVEEEFGLFGTRKQTMRKVMMRERNRREGETAARKKNFHFGSLWDPIPETSFLVIWVGAPA